MARTKDFSRHIASLDLMLFAWPRIRQAIFDTRQSYCLMMLRNAKTMLPRVVDERFAQCFLSGICPDAWNEPSDPINPMQGRMLEVLVPSSE